MSSPEELHVTFENKSDYPITVFANCSVEYSGRAEGYLPRDERIIIWKPDGNLQVHGVTNHKPRNWQPTGAELETYVEDGEFVIEAYHSRNDEDLKIYCHRIDSYEVYEVNADTKVSLDGTEEDMHHAILADPDVIGLNVESLEHEVVIDGAGRVDIYGEQDGTPVLLEVKRTRASLNHADQLVRYTNAVDGAKGILVSPSIRPAALELLERNDLEWRELQPL
ncbi:RecB-like nuclease [Halogranum tailed virus 1]|uniref:RecB-like nuclease n=1 Tax=Halogranum tailed virus 1 TaxID=1273749 RepID=R4TMH0_9CAUD|nr:RecB-like nuclease [Halogranum tailed virus 1]AGM11373.1 RecB-like nuclease [Halogranum tailed virus 1]